MSMEGQEGGGNALEKPVRGGFRGEIYRMPAYLFFPPPGDRASQSRGDELAPQADPQYRPTETQGILNQPHLIPQEGVAALVIDAHRAGAEPMVWGTGSPAKGRMYREESPLA